MKILFLLVVLCVGCTTPVPPPMPPEPMPCPTVAPLPPCKDGLSVFDEADLKQNVVCPANTRLVFPSSVYVQAGKVLVLCQCK